MLIKEEDRKILIEVANRAEKIAQNVNPDLDGIRRGGLLKLALRSRKLCDDSLKMNANLDLKIVLK